MFILPRVIDVNESLRESCEGIDLQKTENYDAMRRKNTGSKPARKTTKSRQTRREHEHHAT